MVKPYKYIYFPLLRSDIVIDIDAIAGAAVSCFVLDSVSWCMPFFISLRTIHRLNNLLRLNNSAKPNDHIREREKTGGTEDCQEETIILAKSHLAFS